MRLDYPTANAPLFKDSGASALAPRRGAAAGPRLILVVFIVAMAFDLIGRVLVALLIRALRKLLLVPARLFGRGRPRPTA